MLTSQGLGGGEPSDVGWRTGAEAVAAFKNSDCQTGRGVVMSLQDERKRKACEQVRERQRGGWTCARCTFRNPQGQTSEENEACEMCGAAQAPRPELAGRCAGEICPREFRPAHGDWFHNCFGFSEHAHALDGFSALYAGAEGGAGASPIQVELYPHPRFPERGNPGCAIVTSHGEDGGEERFDAGCFSTPMLLELRRDGDAELAAATDKLSLRIMRGDAGVIQGKYPFSVWQVAGQLNCLEFVDPQVLPEQGITCYGSDRTQGPAVVTSTGPAVLYRNYLHRYRHLSGLERTGQKGRDEQWNNLARVEMLVENDRHKFWKVVGGYTICPDDGRRLAGVEPLLTGPCRQDFLDLVMVGLHEDTELTGLGEMGRIRNVDKRKTVTHVLCSAVAVANNGVGDGHPRQGEFATFSKFLLQAGYEATLYAGLENLRRHKGKPHANKVFLTLLGGGVFAQ